MAAGNIHSGNFDGLCERRDAKREDLQSRMKVPVKVTGAEKSEDQGEIGCGAEQEISL